MSAQTSRSHVLAIDDDAAMRALYEDLFGEFGFQVTAAPPSATIAHVQKVKPDLVLLDWPYPWSEPPALLQAMRQSADLAALPAILATTALERAAVSLPEDCCTRLLPKPFTVEEILAMTDALLEQARGLTRRSHALRQQLGRTQERQSQVMYRRPLQRNQNPQQA